MASDKPSFFEELKRRHVWRVSAAYVVAGWLVVQVATQVFPFFSIPDWTVRLVVILIAIGFPVAVVCAWVYEITPEGIRRTEPAGSPAARPAHVRRSVGQKLNAIIFAVLVLAIGLLGWRLHALGHTGTAAPKVVQARDAQRAGVDSHAIAAASAARVVSVDVPAIPEKSVAVLPFVNEGGIKDEQFFSDGLSEDLINALSQFAGLKVISRNSAFQFRDSKQGADVIGRKLGVAHLLEGSVRRAGDAVRITATLVKAGDGSILWSQRYDRPYRDLFALQDAITQSVASALKAKLVLAPGAVVQSDRPPSGNLAAYAAYQRGMAYAGQVSEAGTRRAIEAFGEATRLDPHYAAAYAQLANGWLDLFVAWGVPANQVDAKARDALDTALRLDPDSSLAHQARAEFLRSVDMDWRGAEVEARYAVQLAPNDPEARIMLGNSLRRLGQVRDALDSTRQALVSNPRNAFWYPWLSFELSALGRLDEARQATRTAIALQPGGSTFHLQLALIETMQGDAKAARAAAQRESNPAWRAWGLAVAMQIGRDRDAADAALNKLIADYADNFAYSVVQVYALRRDPDRMFTWLDRAWIQRDPGLGILLSDPIVLRYRDDPRFAAFCKKVGLPAATDAVAMK
ncbi:MAG TPA: hypothetical protein VF284_02915 [Rhodanobacteraceae bacterium]